MILVIVTGPPGSGKTTLAKRLARELGWPLISKDGIKEVLFDTLGWSDRAWSQKLGGASFGVLFHILECQLAAGKPALVETAFIPAYHTARFLALRARYGYEPFQILCRADEDVLCTRFQQRIASGERHPGHVDHLTSDAQFREMLRSGRYGALEIGGALYTLDMSDPAQIDDAGVMQAIAAAQE